MQSAVGAPTFVNCVLNVPSVSNTWTRLLPSSPTYTLPCASIAMPCTMLNWPWPVPREPQFLMPLAVAVVLRDARVAVAVGDVDVALRVPRHVGRTHEALAFDACARKRAAGAAAGARRRGRRRRRPPAGGLAAE